MTSPIGRLKQYWTHTGRDVGADPHPIPESDEFVQTNVAITTTDGIKLRGDLYVPKGKGPFPAVVEISPYGSQRQAEFGKVYASRGYLFLAVDCRGRYRSEGNWEPLTFDRQDGHDVLNWLAKHELCNGRVGTRGHSYSGYNQLLAASDAPSCLQAMVVGVAPGDPFYNTPFQGGCYDLNDLSWLLDMTGRVSASDGAMDDADDSLLDQESDDDKDDETDSAEDKEFDELMDVALTKLPFSDVDVRLGVYHPTFRQWISHWQFDDFWQERSVLPGISKTNVPTLHISGWWDGNGRGSTQFFQAMRQQAGSEFSRENQRLLLGPWNHDLKAPDCEALPESEGRFIERGALRDTLNDELAWFDHYLKDLPHSTGCGSRVSLYLTGINKWVDYSDWPVPNYKETAFFLDGKTKVGSLKSAAPGKNQQASYELDPSDPTPFADPEVDAERLPFDNSAIQKERDDLLLFDTAEFDSAFTAIGPVSARIFASADTRDFDIVASAYDVYPDGRSIYLTDGVIRARFRKGFDKPSLVEPGEVCEFDIDLWHIGHVFRSGHRLRLQIASAALLRFDVNPCTGGDLATEQQSQAARITIHQGTDYPSCVFVQKIEQ